MKRRTVGEDETILQYGLSSIDPDVLNISALDYPAACSHKRRPIPSPSFPMFLAGIQGDIWLDPRLETDEQVALDCFDTPSVCVRVIPKRIRLT